MRITDLRLVLPALLILSLALGACTSKKDDNGDDTTPGTAASMATRINNVRTTNGRDELDSNTILTQLAVEQAQINAARGTNSDKDADGVSLADRIRDAGYGFSTVAYLFNNGTEQRSFDEWSSNPAYSGVLLDDDYHDFGVGVATGATQQWWVAIFASEQAPTSDSIEDMLARLNEFRVGNGAEPFTLDLDLSAVAQVQSQHNAESGQNLAVNGDGQTLLERSGDVGYENALVMWTLASGGAESAVTRWTDTQSEEDLMLDDRLANVGIGAAPGSGQQWWVVIYTGAPVE